jgi:hypothetical protein
MADSITSRTMFYDTRNGVVRFHDWNLVNTTLGTMQEPRQFIHLKDSVKSNRGTAQFNQLDQCAKVTNLENVDLRGIEMLLSDKKLKTIGGSQMPKDSGF